MKAKAFFLFMVLPNPLGLVLSALGCQLSATFYTFSEAKQENIVTYSRNAERNFKLGYSLSFKKPSYLQIIYV